MKQGLLNSATLGPKTVWAFVAGFVTLCVLSTALFLASPLTPTTAGTPRQLLKRHLQDQIRVLRDPRTTDFEKVAALRDWAYSHVPTTNSEALTLEALHGYQIYQEPLPKLFSRFSSLEGGFFCAGTAETLAKLYRLYGYEAYTYNMGSPDGHPSHVVTLVRIHDGGKSILSVQDAYLNYALVRKGHPLGFRQLLASLERGTISSIQYLSGDVHCKLLLVKADEVLKARSGLMKLKIRFGPVLETWNGRSCFCYDLQVAAVAPDFEQWLNRRLPQHNFLDLFLFPLGVDGGPDALELPQLAAAVRNSLQKDRAAVN
jgi:hypothetical protein